MPGQYASRGGILDVYSPEADRPLRIEFFGDEADSIRKFDPASQRSSTPVDEALLLPLTETPVSEHLLGAIHTRLSGKRVTGNQEIVEAAVRAAGVNVFPGWEFYTPVAGADHTIFDLIPRASVLLDETDQLKLEFDRFWTRVQEAHERSEVGNLVRPEDLYLPPDDWWPKTATLPGADVEHLGITRGTDDAAITFLTQPSPRFHGAVPVMLAEVQKLNADGKRVLFAVPNIGEVERLADVFTEYNVSFRLGSRTRGGESYADETSYFAGEILTTTLATAYIPDGVLLPEANLAVFGARDLFDESESVATRPQRAKSKVSAFLSDFRDLQVGDYVVHVEHGIGQYQGLKEINHGDGPAEFMLLEFAEAARLYVPLTRLDLVQKYRSSEGAKPVLNHLGTAAWGKTKSRVRKAMKDMADELLKLYAERKTAVGHAFPPANEWFREFEDAFEFNETEDQAQAIKDVIRDMESTQPMDRLLCGDVGYGKTEVAMRGAFKAINDNKQVAVLAPTTVLAFQRFETFKQRFAPFPVTIEMISRFRTPKQQKEILQKTETGKIDVLIGTHRILSKDIKFSDLGLLIVDEEQRFGVRHKERIKQMRKQVDVLTMSATPIPHPAHVADRPARYECHRNSAQRSHGDSNRSRQLGRKTDSVRHRAGARTRRPGLLRSQSRRHHLGDRRQVANVSSFRADYRRSRANVRRPTRKSNAGIHASRSRHSGLDHDHRERSRHPTVQHNPDQPRRPPRPLGALPATRTRRTLQPPRLRLFNVAAGNRTDAHRPPALSCLERIL